MKELEYSHVSPPPGSVPTTSLNLTLFDVPMLGFFAMQRLYFYEFPHPTSYFMDNTLPNLTTSLSLTLQHFFPFAGRLSFPPPPQPLPCIIYKEGDSPVPFIVKESTADFNHLIGDHPRHIEELRVLVPKLPPLTMAPNGCKEKPLLAIQITVFPMAGICIGVAYCHGAADGRAASHFIKSWANTHRSQIQLGDHQYLNNSLPNFDRDLIKDPSGFASKLFMIKREREELPWISVDKLRVNFSIKRSQVMLLKDWIAKRWSDSEEIKRLSTFVVICAYMWICLIKLQDIQSKNDDNCDALCHLIFSVDCREHLKLPTTYFGNCIAVQYLSAKKSEIKGENGIVVAARTIGKRIMEIEKAPLNGAEKWGLRGREIFNSGDHYASVVSSPKLGSYKIDFGWGRPKKSDVTHIGINKHFSLIESRDEEGGVELGLTLSSHEFDSFNAIFYQGLSKLK